MATATPIDLTAGYWALVNARPDYETACAFYDGTVGDAPSSPKVARLLAKYGLEITDFNFAAIPVNVIADKLHLNQVTTEDDNADVLIDELRDVNELDEELPILLRNACKYGDAYLMVWPKVVRAENGDAGVIQSVTMRYKDPLTTRVFYSAEDPLEKAYAIQSWETNTKSMLVVRADLYYADRIERYSHKGKVPPNSKFARWEPYNGDGIAATLDNPFGEVPFFHFRTDRTYGVPVHKAAYGPQTAINKLITSHLATVDYQSFPQRYALIDPTADRSGTQSNDFDEDHPEDGFDPETAAESQLESSPAAMWDLQGYKSVGQFESADPDVFLKPLDRYIKATAQVTQIPMSNFEGGSEQRLSGESRRVANEPLYNRVEALQRSFGSTTKRAYEFALNILGEDVSVNVKWQPIRIIDDLAGLQALLIERDFGVPDDVLLAKIGHDSALVDKWLSAPKAKTTATETTGTADAEL